MLILLAVVSLVVVLICVVVFRQNTVHSLLWTVAAASMWTLTVIGILAWAILRYRYLAQIDPWCEIDMLHHHITIRHGEQLNATILGIVSASGTRHVGDASCFSSWLYAVCRKADSSTGIVGICRTDMLWPTNLGLNQTAKQLAKVLEVKCVCVELTSCELENIGNSIASREILLAEFMA